MQDPSDWLAWQLADSAFPSGGFAHSLGLEVIWKQGEIPDENVLTHLLSAMIRQVRHSDLPIVATVLRDPPAFRQADHLAHAMMLATVSARASSAQGRALLVATGQAFDSQLMRNFQCDALHPQAHSHLAAVFGGVAYCLGLSAERTLSLYLFITLRSILSAAVRLGIVGPLKTQAILHNITNEAETLASAAINDTLDDACQPAPLLDLLRANHDRLYSRLFQS